jgi:tetratricopeptide (TPR) repeat protein
MTAAPQLSTGSHPILITKRDLILKLVAATALLAALIAAYANHFDNSFHFDDFHTIQNNIHIRSLANIPRFFTDSSTFSSLPTHQVYRPLLTSTLALDYVRGDGRPEAFHVTTFALYLTFLAAVYWLTARILRDPFWAFAATVVYALHPVCAETVNYIVQRAEILSTLGVVAGLALYFARPEWRHTGIYLVPVVLGMLAKPPAMIFPVLLFAAIALFEPRTRALRAVLPSIAVCAATALLLHSMTAATFNSGGTDPWLYRLTQTRIALHYFVSFFAPLHLSADSDWQPFTSAANGQALLGIAFLTLIGAAIFFTARRGNLRPIAFGLIWFLAALFPTSWMPLAEVANDHRMFFPFVGLALAAAHTLRLLFDQHRTVCAIALCLIAVVEVRATALRNEIWRTEETLWRDVVEKSPGNGRGLMNYGLTRMAKGDAQTALAYFERAHRLLPAYFILEINLGIALAQLNRHSEAEPHFARALALEPTRYEPHYFYGRWLHQQGRSLDALPQLEQAVRANANALDARHLLLELYAAAGEQDPMQSLARETLQLNPGDPLAAGYLNRQLSRSPDSHLNRSLILFRAGRYADSIAAANEALRLRPRYAEAYNNIAAAANALGRWDEGIRAAEEALRIKPDFALARNNRQWAIHKKEGR